MSDADLLKRITVNPEIFGGKPIIRSTRIAVEHIREAGYCLSVPARLVHVTGRRELLPAPCTLCYGRQ